MFPSTDRSLGISKFWSWFDENKSHYMDSESDWDPDLAMLQEKLDEVDNSIQVEITTDMKSFFELIITANGFIELFPVVREVVDKAPEIEGWTIVAFKQPLNSDFILQNEYFEVKSTDLYFLPYLEDDYLEIVIYGENLDHNDDEILIYYGRKILIDVIGEYDAATKVNSCFMYDMEDMEKESLMPLKQLKGYIDGLFNNSN